MLIQPLKTNAIAYDIVLVDRMKPKACTIKPFPAVFCRIVIRLSVCHCQSLSPWSNICRQGWSLPQWSGLQDSTVMGSSEP
jgi:hypothetical protein